MIQPGDIFRIVSITTPTYLLAVDKSEVKKGFSRWNLFVLSGKNTGRFYRAEDYWLENQERLT